MPTITANAPRSRRASRSTRVHREAGCSSVTMRTTVPEVARRDGYTRHVPQKYVLRSGTRGGLRCCAERVAGGAAGVDAVVPCRVDDVPSSCEQVAELGKEHGEVLAQVGLDASHRLPAHGDEPRIRLLE